MTDTRYTAAWVPDDADHRPWDVAFALAADWIEAQSGQPLLITPTARAGRVSRHDQVCECPLRDHTAQRPVV